MPKLELMMKDFDVKTKETVLDFIAVCSDLESLISRENMLLLDKGSVAFEGMFIRKINMLNRFEKDIRDVLLLTKECAPDNIGLRKTLIDKIQNVRRVLSINTTFQLHDLKKRTKRMAMLKDTLIDYSKHSEEGDAACH
jgi:hypothetical protein